jgi:1-acyl-sn-glycerol-3-phosphate acyltransferase
LADETGNIHYPRRRPIRWLLRSLIRMAFPIFADIEIEGIENFPGKGPLLVVGNHFNFLDPVALIKITDWPLEFVGGSHRPNAPSFLSWFADTWGILPVFRGSVSRSTMLASKAVLAQGGVLATFPEGGSWASVLRPARPGAAFLASQSNAPLLPVGFDGLVDVFPKFRRGKRARVKVRIGQLFGPFFVSERGETNRMRLDEIGNEIMRHIAELIPPERRGYYSNDPAIREAARNAAAYPWKDNPEI